MTDTDVEKLLASLHREGVEFVIIGGIAAVLHGSAYVTADLDICYSRSKPNLDRLARALAPFHPALRGIRENVPFCLDASALQAGTNFTLSTDAVDVDLLGEVKGLGTYQEVSAFSEQMEIFGMMCSVLTLDGLIKSKQATRRPKDLLLLPELEALIEIRKAQKI